VTIRRFDSLHAQAVNAQPELGSDSESVKPRVSWSSPSGLLHVAAQAWADAAGDLGLAKAVDAESTLLLCLGSCRASSFAGWRLADCLPESMLSCSLL
jgi:hypothetical protein